MFNGLLRPGQGFKAFNRLVAASGELQTDDSAAKSASGRPKSESGRPQNVALKKAGVVIGILSKAQQEEKDQWKQEGHPISHTLIQRGVANQATPSDYLQLNDNGRCRYFSVQGINDPGELHHITVYYILEREDLHGSLGAISSTDA